MCPDPLMASALCRLVGEVEDTSTDRLRIHELQSLPISPVLEESLPAAQDYRVDHEPELTEEIVLKQRPDEGAASEDRDVLTGLPLELGDLLRDVTLDQRRVLPLEELL